MAQTLHTLLPIELPTRFADCSELRTGDFFEERTWDECLLKGRLWKGADERAVILYLHGIEGHSQWFAYTASELNKLGVTVYAVDRRGAGLNSEERGHLPSFAVYLRDVEHMLQQIRRDHKNQAIVLVANCWSAKAAAHMARRTYTYHGGKPAVSLAGLVLTNPALTTRVDFGLSTKLAIAVSSLLGGEHARRTWPIPLTTEMLTGNPVFQDFLKRDPLRLKHATASFYAETFKLGVLAHFSAPSIDLPTLIIQSEKDAIVDVPKVKSWFSRLKAPEKKFLSFAEATHSLDFDQHVFHEYVQVLDHWLQERECEYENS